MENPGQRVQKHPPFSSCRKVPGLEPAPYPPSLNKVAATLSVHYVAGTGTGRKSANMKADHMIGIVVSQS